MRVEEEQTKFEKLESLGVLAGGIAHDFNNILTAILGNVTLASLEAAEGKEIVERLSDVEKAALRASDLTKQPLAFSKGGEPVKKMISLSRLLREAATFGLRGAKVKCEFVLPEDLWALSADEGQIAQVIQNLAINADQAMPEGGVIRIAAGNITLGEKTGLPLPPGA